MAVKDNSDYTRLRTKLYDLVPEVFKSDTNRAVFGNLFDRYMTKQESTHAVGYVGRGNLSALTNRRIAEPTLHREAFQLQPILRSKVGSVEHMASWEDLRNEYDRLGVDIEKFDEWGEVLQFNWIPPIDIDKLIHYEDYYWFNENDVSSKPEYITMRSRCSTAIANSNFWQRLVDQYGSEFPITELMADDNPSDLPEFSIFALVPGTDQVTVNGDITAELQNIQYFNIIGTVNNNGIYKVTSSPVYDAPNDRSTFSVEAGSISVLESAIGTVTMRRFNRLRLAGEYHRLLEAGFIFFIRDTLNTELNDAFWQSAGAEYDSNTNETVVTLTTYVTDSIQGGVVSLQENLNFYLAEQACQCSGGIGWDVLLWDDNPTDPIWNGELATLLTNISNPGPPPLIPLPTDNDLWYDTTNDKFYQYHTNTDWKLMYNNFSLILDRTEGFALWDYTEDCGLMARVPSATQWTDTNFWLHKTDVPNFAKAKQAQLPILEFDWDLELNEWTLTNFNWEYRIDNLGTFEPSTIEPSLIELQPIDIWTRDIGTNEIVIDDRFGDLTGFFEPGVIFQADTLAIEFYEVERSSYVADTPGEPYKTRVTLVGAFPVLANDTPLIPTRTSHGDYWKTYGDHWLYTEEDNAIPTAHQPDNPFILPALTAVPVVDVDYDYVLGYGSQIYTVTSSSIVSDFIFDASVLSGTTRPLTERALVGQDNVRVYINDIRQYGTYSELDPWATGFVTGVSFIGGLEPDRFDDVRVEVGEASIDDIGNYRVPVRTVVDNAAYLLAGDEIVSLTKYRRAEQVKTQPNQYPLFDIYNVDSSPANEASAIFGYATSPDANVNLAVGLRTIQDDVNRIFDFDQFIIEQNDGILKAWRDYSNQVEDIWYNPLTRELFFFNDLSWSKKTDMGGHYREAIVSSTEPDAIDSAIEGLYWVDTLNDIIFIRESGNWVEVSELDIRTSDITLQSIWRKGLNNETYIPAKVDWIARDETEYNSERDLFVTERAQEILASDSSLSDAQATAQATTEWLNSQANPHSTTGVWVGDWEVPDPLYHNHLNENRKIVDSRELLTHFTTIIDNQPRISGYHGNNDSMFHLIPTNAVNYGVGGTIHEYNDSYDTAFSSTFVNNVTPVTLFEFAHDQYKSLLNNMEELFRRNAVDYFLDVSEDSLVFFTETIANSVIELYELNDNASIIYGDSTTFTDVEGVDDIGIKNWIATLPYLKLIYAVTPEKLTDLELELNQIIHHDGHRNVYSIEQAVIEEIIGIVINTPDGRTRFPGPQDPPLDTFGRVTTTDLPPNDITEFAAEFNTAVLNREGVYWYHTPSLTDRTLYRLEVASIGTEEPVSTLPDGTLWFDATVGLEVLRQKYTSEVGVVTWEPAVGNTVGDGRLHNGSDVATATVSAWVAINLNEMLSDIVLEVETRLFANVPDAPRLRYDFEATAAANPVDYDTLLRQSFLDYVSQSEITGPFVNSDYDATDPFTWNYKYSVPGAGFNVVSADAVNNTISVQGDQAAFFDPCQFTFACPSTITFYIKNSITNDGKWTATGTSGFPVAIYDGLNDVTIITVNEPVNPGDRGLAYSGTLPSSTNDGSESGGDWRDYYNKLYGTPYPHLEPWKLQGYNGKPDWWDAEYENVEPLKWGVRRWNYKHGFSIVDVTQSFGSLVNDTFSIDGDFRELFPSTKTFLVESSPSHFGNYSVLPLLDIDSVNLGGTGTSSLVFVGNVVPTIFVGMHFTVDDGAGNFVKTLTVKTSTFTGPPDNETIVVVEEIISDATDFVKVGGAVYDSLSNRTSILTDAVSLASIVEGRIALATGMWEQIRVGNIKAGERYPNNVLSVTGNPGTDIATHGIQDPGMPTYNYFSVNVDNITITSDGGITNYDPDEILPPYWDYVPQYGASVLPLDLPIRSVFFNFSTEITTPSIDYLFGDAGPIEFDWRTSSQYLYDQLTVAYKLDPIRLVTHTFGIDFVEIGDLQVESTAEKVLSHNRTDFHGEIIDNELYQVAGTNQWYVNFNRFSGFDVSLADFRALWVDWTAPLMYQMASFVDTDSINIGHRQVPLSESDYNIVAKRSPAVEDFWNDAFSVSVLTIPPKLIAYDTQGDWRFEVSTNANRSRRIQYYGVHNYQFNVDLLTDTCKLYTWPIHTASTFSDSITVQGDQLETFVAGRIIDIANSTANDGTYTIESAVYDSATELTTVILEEQLPSGVDGGDVTVQYRTMPWSTGDSVYLSSTRLLPIPLETDNINGLYQYFVIVIDDSTFRLALTQQNALDGNHVPVTGVGSGDSFVGEVQSTFTALLGERTSTVWRNYAIDKETILSFDTPHDVMGVQNMINIMYGYDVRNFDDGWRVNDENSETDFDTDRIVSWQVEIERFINTIYSLRTTRESVNDRYSVSVDASTDTWTFLEPNTQYITGDPVNIISTGGVPAPLIQGLRYYMIRDTFDEFKLATTKQNAQNNIAIDVTSTGSGNLSILAARDITYSAPVIEVNPSRNGIWFRPERGIVSDVIGGPTEDIRDQQLLFDQYSRPLTLDQIRIFREDKRTQISIASGLTNDVELGSDTLNPYNNIHLGGAHIFVDTFEHVTMFNNYTSADSLIYDPFIGLNLTKIEYDFERQTEFTQRPNMGGFYFETFFNQNASLKRNIEANIEDMRYAYDTYTVQEGNSLVEHSRKSLGYEGSTDYLNNLNLNDKSQFAFWRGMIQQKGSVNAVKAFVNSRRFIDAKVDEFWTYKIADFGSSFEQEYPELFVTTVDSRSNDFKMEFLTDTNPTPDNEFVGVEGTDEERWFNQPDQVEILRDKGTNLYFDLSARDSLVLTTIPDSPLIRHNFKAGSVAITANYYVEGHVASFAAATVINLSDAYLVGTTGIQVFANGILQVEGVDYVETDSTTITFGSLPAGQVDVHYVTSTLIEGTHFEQVNSNIVRLLTADPTINTTVWGLHLNEDGQNPARLIDREAETVISAIQIWDPARGHHYFNSLHNIQLMNDADMALYNNGTNSSLPQQGPWGKEQVGTTWLDTLELDYIPYYDTDVFPLVDDRLRLWGQLAGWANTTMYEWVKSDIPPSEYDAVAVSEGGDNSIPEATRKSGIARKVLFEKVGIDWIPLRTKYEEYDAAMEGTSVGNDYSFGVSLTGLVDVYVNGLLIQEQITATPTMVVDCDETDRVRFVTRVPTQEVIDANPLLYLQDYQYSTFTWYDELNNPHIDYYFWVEDKGTIDRTTTRTLSALVAAQQLVTIPISYMVTQKVLPEQRIVTEPNTLLGREEYYIATVAQTEYFVGLDIAPGTPVSVFVDGFVVAPGDITININSITLATPATGGEDIKIEYTGLYDIATTVPTRYVQAIIRGLRGLIDADRRYAVRFTRDFTLRDDLEVGRTSLELKNHHEEWKIFREAQQFHIDRYLWDKVTEAMVGYKLSDPTIRVPSLNRELYDVRYLTSTQIGLRNGQKFTDGPLAIQTVLADLQNPDNNFQPVDINVFFNTYNFDTNEDIIESMNTIYNTFPYEHVNRIYFSVLNDAFSFKDKYEDMFKTSMVALHGVKPFKIAGIFDD